MSGDPYEGIRTSERIVEVIEKMLIKGMDIKKKFYDM